MPRTESLFAISSVALLALGLIAPLITPSSGFSTYHGAGGNGVSYAFAWQTPCYGMAALFGGFAFLYSIGYIQFSRVTAQWHFWLSLGSVAWCVVGVIVLIVVVRGAALPPPLGTFGTIFAVSVLATVPVFLAAQLWFAVALTRALLRMRQP